MSVGPGVKGASVEKGAGVLSVTKGVGFWVGVGTVGNKATVGSLEAAGIVGARVTSTKDIVGASVSTWRCRRAGAVSSIVVEWAASMTNATIGRIAITFILFLLNDFEELYYMLSTDICEMVMEKYGGVNCGEENRDVFLRANQSNLE